MDFLKPLLFRGQTFKGMSVLCEVMRKILVARFFIPEVTSQPHSRNTTLSAKYRWVVFEQELQNSISRKIRVHSKIVLELISRTLRSTKIVKQHSVHSHLLVI